MAWAGAQATDDDDAARCCTSRKPKPSNPNPPAPKPPANPHPSALTYPSPIPAVKNTCKRELPHKRTLPVPALGRPALPHARPCPHRLLPRGPFYSEGKVEEMRRCRGCLILTLNLVLCPVLSSSAVVRCLVWLIPLEQSVPRPKTCLLTPRTLRPKTCLSTPKLEGLLSGHHTAMR